MSVPSCLPGPCVPSSSTDRGAPQIREARPFVFKGVMLLKKVQPEDAILPSWSEDLGSGPLVAL